MLFFTQLSIDSTFKLSTTSAMSLAYSAVLITLSNNSLMLDKSADSFGLDLFSKSFSSLANSFRLSPKKGVLTYLLCCLYHIAKLCIALALCENKFFSAIDISANTFGLPLG